VKFNLAHEKIKTIFVDEKNDKLLLTAIYKS